MVLALLSRSYLLLMYVLSPFALRPSSAPRNRSFPTTTFDSPVSAGSAAHFLIISALSRMTCLPDDVAYGGEGSILLVVTPRASRAILSPSAPRCRCRCRRRRHRRRRRRRRRWRCHRRGGSLPRRLRRRAHSPPFHLKMAPHYRRDDDELGRERRYVTRENLAREAGRWLFWLTPEKPLDDDSSDENYLQPVKFRTGADGSDRERKREIPRARGVHTRTMQLPTDSLSRSFACWQCRRSPLQIPNKWSASCDIA